MDVVYFLGAGFSAAYGLPVMNQFFTFAKQSDFLNENEKRFLSQIQRFAHMGVRIVTVSRNNMEEILSFLEMAEQAGQIPEELQKSSEACGQAGSLPQTLRGIIAKVYYESLPTEWPDYGQSIVRTFGLGENSLIQFLGPKGSIWQRDLPNSISGGISLNEMVVITTNYDLCLETQLLRMKIPLRFRLAGNWISIEGNPQGKGDQEGAYNPDSSATLVRLHGAVNWRETKGRSNGEGRGLTVCSRVEIDTYDDRPQPPRIVIRNIIDPAMVAPTVFKHQADGPYAAQWQEAARALAEARHIVFIGYSFPESDAYMRYFLGASLANNVNIEGIHIVDPNANEIAKRLQQDSRYGAHFLDMLRPHPRCWQD